MPSCVLRLGVQPIGEPRTGGWCGRCLLPSMIEVDFVISSGRATVGRTTARRCLDCGAR